MESVTMDVVVEEECLGIQDQASGEVQVSMEAQVSHCHLLAKAARGFCMKCISGWHSV